MFEDAKLELLKAEIEYWRDMICLNGNLAAEFTLHQMQSFLKQAEHKFNLYRDSQLRKAA